MENSKILKWFIILVMIGVSLASFSSCEKEYNIDIQTPENPLPKLIVYESSPTEACPYGELNIEEWHGDSLLVDISSCKKPDFVLPPSSPNSVWGLISGECDTIINYFEHDGVPGFSLGDSLVFKIPLCTQVIILPGDTIIIHDPIPYPVYDTVIIQGENWVRETFIENCNNSGNSPYYSSIGWNLGEGFSINQIGSGTGNGTIVLWSGLVNADTLWTPNLFSEPMSVDSISIYLGSINNYIAEVLLKDVDGNIFFVDILNVYKAEFNWQNLSTFVHETYSVDLDNLLFQNITNLGIAIYKSGDFCPNSRDEKFNADNVYVRGVKKLN